MIKRQQALPGERTNDRGKAISNKILLALPDLEYKLLRPAAGILQKKKAIEYSRGTVRILSRKKLEAAACECYKIIQQFLAEPGDASY